jgi:acetyltransferase-like isoleucine patch superfamily enzyme
MCCLLQVTLPKQRAAPGYSPGPPGSLRAMAVRSRLLWAKEMAGEVRDHVQRSRDPVAFFRSRGARIGDGCRLIGCNFGSEPYLVTLGDHVSATATAFVTHDGGVWVFRDEWPDADVIAPIVVGNNVYLGAGVLVLPGVTIGDDVVVGARSVVTRDLPSGCVALGTPARPVRSLAEYRAALEPRLLPTKNLDPAAKRAALEQRFGR